MPVCNRSHFSDNFRDTARFAAILSCSPDRMSTTALSKRTSRPSTRPLPVIAHFADDPVCERYLHGVQRFRRVQLGGANTPTEGAERVVLVSKEELIEQHYRELRVPNTRVLALSDRRFHDPRNDGAVYAYLPANV